GMRPTGKPHIGHYSGALENWVRWQNDPANDCFYFIADWHALTSDYADTSAVAQSTIEIVTDYLAAGLDPQKSVIFQQSLIPEHAELHLLLGMVTPLGWLERVPTYKEQIENVTSKDLHTYGFLGYPCLQTADIVMYSEPGAPLLVPVGEDQVSHVELSREIVRRFNLYYGLTLQLRNANSAEEVIPIARLKGAIDRLEGKSTEIRSGSAELDIDELESRVRRLAESIGLTNLQKKFAELEKVEASGDPAAGKYKLFGDAIKFDEVLSEPQVQLTKAP